jgi:hypothetical protein
VPRRPPWEVPTDETFRYEPPRSPPAAEPTPVRRPPWEVPDPGPTRPGPYGYDAGPAAPPRPDPGPPVRRPEPGPPSQPPPPRHADPGPASQPAPPRRVAPGPPSQPVRRVDPGPPSQPVPAYQPPREPVPDRRMPWETGPAEDLPKRSRREERDSGPAPERGVRRRRGPRLAAVIVAVSLALGVAGFGGWYFTLRKTAVTPTDYAAAVCGGMKSWKQDMDGQGSALNKSIQQIDDLPATRGRVIAYYDTLATRTETLRTSLVGAGAPPGGQAYADALVRAVTDQVAALRDASARATKLDVTGPSTLFQISLNGLLTNATTAEGKVVDALAHPQVTPPAEIAAALQDNADCTPFTG